MEQTKHSIDQVKLTQQAFERLYTRESGVLGVGIGMNSRQDDLALTVYVATEEDMATLPKRFEGVDVVCDVVGSFSAF